jgi:hypothetical protein
VSGTNAQLQRIVEAARTAAKEGRDYDAIDALVQITAISAVQQNDLAGSINELAAKVAADDNADIAAEAAALEAVSGATAQGGVRRARRLPAALPQGCFGRDPPPRDPPRVPPTKPTPTHPPMPPQEYSGAPLDKKVGAKVGGIPDIVHQIEEQQADLGHTSVQSEAGPKPRAAGDKAGIIAGAVAGGAALLGLAALALVVVLRRRRAAGVLGAAAAGAAAAGPVAEASEAAADAAYAAPRSGAALQRHSSTDGGAAPAKQ